MSRVRCSVRAHGGFALLSKLPRNVFHVSAEEFKVHVRGPCTGARLFVFRVPCL